MADPGDDRLEKLSERIERARKVQEAPKPRGDEHYSQAQTGWRMVVELVAGLLIGISIGYGLDVLLGTLPILLVLFTLLGFAAGVNTMLRTAREIEAENDKAEKSARDTRD